MKFEDYKLDASICEALHTLGYQSPLPVQEAVIPLMLEKKDILVKSRTGSGKTASFAIPIIQDLIWEERSPQALVLSPTRELALQIKGEFDNIGAYKRIKTAAVFGKQPFRFSGTGCKAADPCCRRNTREECLTIWSREPFEQEKNPLYHYR